MGSKLSNFISAKHNDKNSFTGEASKMEDTWNFSIPDDLLIDILSYVPAKDLILNCSLVCKDWKNVVDGHSVWKLKCAREKKNIPSITFHKIPKHYYEKIYLHDPFDRNLIRNPCGEDGLANWIVKTDRTHGFAIENPPVGADPVPQEVGSQSCFAVSYYPCLKHQVINLLADGISEEILQLETTKIIVGEWFAARFDCAAEYHLYVNLLENFQEDDPSQDCVVDDFRYLHLEHQWGGKEWHLVTHTFENVGRARFVYFRDFGKDRQYVAGLNGCKMTGAFVKVVT